MWNMSVLSDSKMGTLCQGRRSIGETVSMTQISGKEVSIYESGKVSDDHNWLNRFVSLVNTRICEWLSSERGLGKLFINPTDVYSCGRQRDLQGARILCVRTSRLSYSSHYHAHDSNLLGSKTNFGMPRHFLPFRNITSLISPLFSYNKSLPGSLSVV